MSAARVYLMADFGKGPVNCGPCRKTPHSAFTLTAGVYAHAQTMERARTWWLVEAESAEAARKVIARDSDPRNNNSTFATVTESMYGRILASGGAK